MMQIVLIKKKNYDANCMLWWAFLFSKSPLGLEPGTFHNLIPTPCHLSQASVSQCNFEERTGGYLRRDDHVEIILERIVLLFFSS